jgi:hypothetical protein
MSQIQFKHGTFHKLRATTTFHLGPIQTDLVKDQEVEFDGITLKMGGESHPMPTLKGAVLGGWLVPVSDTSSTYRAQPAGVQLHQADTTKGDRVAMRTAVITEEEQVVGQVHAPRSVQAAQQPQTAPQQPQTAQQQAAGRQAQVQYVPGRKQLPNGQVVPAWFDEGVIPPWPVRKEYKSEAEFSLATDEYNGAVINQIAYGQPIQKPVSMGGERHNSADGSSGRRVGAKGQFTVQAMDSQQGTSIGQVKTSSISAPASYEGDPKLKEYTNTRGVMVDSQSGAVLNSESAGTLIRDQGAIRNLQAQVGGTPQWQNPTVTVGSAPQVAAIDDGVDPAHMRRASMPVVQHDDLIVTIDRSIGDAMGAGAVSTPTPGDSLFAAAARPPEEAVQELTQGLKHTGPQRKSPEDSIKEIVATWDKSQHWRARVSEAVECYPDSPAIIDAICAIEGPGIVKRIRSAIANLNG